MAVIPNTKVFRRAGFSKRASEALERHHIRPPIAADALRLARTRYPRDGRDETWALWVLGVEVEDADQPE